jgi:pimeloyl-ACP methyl ester carboxylesterase
VQDRSVEGAGIRLQYLDWRPADRTPRPAVVLLHGMSSNALFWGRVAHQLPEEHLIAIDLRGHGRSDRPNDGYNTETMAADVASAMTSLGLTHSVVVGHSWGAAVALVLAARWQQVTAALVLIDGPTASLSARMSLAQADEQMRPPPPCYAKIEDAENDQARFLGDAWGDDLRAFVRRSYEHSKECWRPVLPEAGRVEMVEDLYDLQPERLLPQLSNPVLVVSATDNSDGVAPTVLGWWRSQAEIAASYCRNGQVKRYESRHDIPLIRPDALARDLDRLTGDIAG